MLSICDLAGVIRKITSRRSTAIVSALRGYSAPVDLAMPMPAPALAALVTADDDAFTRWWASEELMIGVIDAHRAGRPSEADAVLAPLVGALRHAIRHETDLALLAQLLAPDEFMLGDREPRIDVDGVAAGLAHLRREVGNALHDDLLALLATRAGDDPAGIGPGDIAARMLVEPVLGYLLATGSAADRKSVV